MVMKIDFCYNNRLPTSYHVVSCCSQALLCCILFQRFNNKDVGHFRIDYNLFFFNVERMLITSTFVRKEVLIFYLSFFFLQASFLQRLCLVLLYFCTFINKISHHSKEKNEKEKKKGMLVWVAAVLSHKCRILLQSEISIAELECSFYESGLTGWSFVL